MADSETIKVAIVRGLGFSATTTVYQLILHYDLFQLKKILIADSNPKKTEAFVTPMCEFQDLISVITP